MAELGFTDATDIGMTCATVGILSGIFGGLFFIKIGTKRGWTKYIESFQYISGDLKTGLIRDEDKRGSMGRETVASVVLDPLAWHLALLLVASGAGFLANGWIKNATGLDLPSYLLAFIIAIVMFLCFQKTGVGHYIDNTVISRISGTATDYLVFFGIASIKISVIVEYAVPLLMLLLFGMVLVVLTLMYFGPAMNKGSWFERSLFVWGYSTRRVCHRLYSAAHCGPGEQVQDPQRHGPDRPPHHSLRDVCLVHGPRHAAPRAALAVHRALPGDFRGLYRRQPDLQVVVDQAAP